MPLLRNLIDGIKALLLKQQRSHDMDEELLAFQQASAEEKIRGGLNPQEAQRAARAEMGSTETVKQKVRSATWESTAESIAQDIRYGIRQLLRSPGFTTVAILTLALGIGANTAIFTLVHAVLLQSLPVTNPQQLYRIGDGNDCCSGTGLQGNWNYFSYAFYQHLIKSTPQFEQIAAFSTYAFPVSVRQAASSAPAQTTEGKFVSGNYFSTFGMQPAAGRLIAPTDDTPEASAVAVMSYRIWQQRYGSDPSLIGSALTLNGIPVTLIGVTPPGFFGEQLTVNPPEIWIPLHKELAFSATSHKLDQKRMSWLYLIGRLRPGLSPQPLESQLTLKLQQWLRAEGELSPRDLAKLPKQKLRIGPGNAGITHFQHDAKDGLYLLSIASLVVLLIACANLANLLLTRSTVRHQQTALRLSLGASRGRLIRAVLTESLLLSLLGGLAGIGLAYAATKAILLIAFRGASFVPIETSPSLPILGFALLLSVITGVIFGVAPAWISTRVDPADGLRGNSRSTTTRAALPQRLLVIVQAALSIVLLVVAGLVTQSLRNLENAELGFQTGGRVIVSIDPMMAGYKPEQLPALYEQIQERLDQMPGVRSSSISLYSPQNHCCWNGAVSIAGRSDEWIKDVSTTWVRVSPAYFDTIGSPVLRGRPITADDTPTSQRVAVIDEAFAHRFFPDEDPIGKHFGQTRGEPGHDSDYEIVGVIKNTNYIGVTNKQNPMYFLPLLQTIHYSSPKLAQWESASTYAQSIQLHVANTPESYEKSIRQALSSINPNLSVLDVTSFREQVNRNYNQQRLIARLAELFGVLALVLASVGLYGVTAYNVTRRTNEIGIRMALGANRRKVVNMVLRGALSQIGIGLSIGIPLAIFSGRYLAHQLYGIGSFNPIAVGGAIFVLSLCAFIAGLIPARRAASIDPTEALRME
jgi:predicted permease